MKHILIAAFDRYTDAEQVKQQLQTQGVASDDIQLSASSNPAMTESSHVEVSAPDESVGEKVAGFFRSVFGDEADAHAGTYSHVMQQGSTVVTVTVGDAQVEMVEDLLVRNGAIDINERSASWGAKNATPRTASTETLTTGYPDATSASTSVRDYNKTRGAGLEQNGSLIPGRAENEHAPRRESGTGRVRIITR
ncbi:hypothetical protein ACX0MV_15685 [Pseudomonas borbori]